MNDSAVRQLLQRFQQGEIELDTVLREWNESAGERTVPTTDAHVDVDRAERCGFPEVVFCEGKTTESIVEIFQAIQQRGQPMFGTRVSPEQAAGLLEKFPDAKHNPIARTIRAGVGRETVAAANVFVVTAGTSDRPVAEEAVETLYWMGCPVKVIFDVGVAGPHRLPEHQQRLQQAQAIVVVAGMEGALPSVVGGYVSCPVIAVPTSIGYGASFGGVAALLGMLNSCAANVTVVNIDAGFKGGYVAGLIAQRAAKRQASREKE